VAELHLDARAAVLVEHLDRASPVAVGFEQGLEFRRRGCAGVGGLPVHREAHRAREAAARTGDVVDPLGGDAHELGLALLTHGAATASGGFWRQPPSPGPKRLHCFGLRSLCSAASSAIPTEASRLERAE